MIAQDVQPVPFQPAPTAPAVTAPPQQPRKRPVLRAAMITSIFLLGSIAGGTAGAAVLTRAQTPTVTTASSSTGTSLNVAAGSVAALYSQAVPGVVTITQVTSQFGQTGQGTGSGIVVDTQGHILTNAHVVSGAQQIQVTFSDGRTVTATLAGIDTTADLAVIKVSVAASSLHPLTLGNSNSVQVGDSVYEIGAPFGLSGAIMSGWGWVFHGINRDVGGARTY